MMDWQTGILCMVFAFISSIVIYIILSVSSTDEDSFEEAKANRRKMMKQQQDENKLSHEKSKEKKNKKMNKKLKEKKENVDGSESESRGSTVESDNGKKLEHRSSTKASVKLATSTSDHNEEVFTKIKEKKKIVHSLEQQCDPSENSSDSHKGSNTISAPLEKVGVAKENKKKKKDIDNEKPNVIKESSSNDSMSSSVNNEEASKLVQQNQVTQNLTNRPVVSSVKPSKKKRTEITSINQLKNEKEAVSINLLVSLIKKAELSRSEIQMLIDALLNKQQDDVSEWLKGRQDPIVKLKKQLAEGEQALKDEKLLNTSLQNKLRDLRSELANDRVAARNVEEQIVTLQTEIRSLTHKLHTITEEKNAANLNCQQIQKQLNDEQKLVMKLKEDQTIELRITEKQNHEVIIKHQSQTALLSGQLQEKIRIIEEFREMHTEITTELKAKERALSDAKNEIENLNATNKNLYEQNDHLSNQLKNQCQEMNILREKNESLAKINAENWENNFSYNKKQGITELEESLEERSNQLEQLTKEVEFKNTKIQELSHNLMRSKSESAKSQMLLDKANAEISLLKEKVNEVNRSIQEDAIGQLKNNLNERNKEISLLKNEIELCKQRNNTLRNKNWKIVEALTKAEKALQTKLRNEQNFNEHKTCVNADNISIDIQKIHGIISRLVKHLYPDIVIAENKESLDEWLSSLEEVIMSRTINGTDNLMSVSDIQAHNNHLQALVVHYKGIITDTERMLNQLQKHVEVEEAQWKGKIKSLEEEIAKLRSNRGTDIFLHP